MKKIILFGSSNGGIRIFYLLSKEYEVIAFADNDNKKQGTFLLGKPIIDPLDIDKYDFDLIIITNKFGYEIKKQIVNDLGIDEEKIIDYYINNFYDTRIATLRMVADEINLRALKGSVAELGVYLGEFAQYINELFPERKLYLFDTFEGFNKEDVDLEEQYGYSSSKPGEYFNKDIDIVLSKMINKENCIIKKGYFPETVDQEDESFVFVSLDVDLYKPTYEGLKYFYPRLVEGGYIFIHDYNNVFYSGVKKAVYDYCNLNTIKYVPMCDLGGSIVIVK